MDFNRALVRVLKSIFCKSIRRLLEGKRACIGFELHEKSLQILISVGMICRRRKDMVMDRHILRSLTPQPPLLQRGGVQGIICLRVERLPLTNLLGDDLKLFLIHRGIAHSTPLPMGEGSGVGPLPLSVGEGVGG